MMAETRKYIPNVQQLGLELEEILREAKHRWLRPAEICEILRNYRKFELTSVPPITPPAGSLFLFDRKALRYFRKDGHRWRKKKDGRTVREAHEKLKAGSVDVLHCYYAHGEDDDNFQRRCYWMLDEQLEHIVLVHYREIKEGCRSGISHFPVVPVTQVGGSQSSSAPSSGKINSPLSVAQTSFTSSENKVDQNGRASEYKDADSQKGLQASSHAQPISNSILCGAPRLAHETTGGFSQLPRNPFISWSSSLPSFSSDTGLSPWALVQNSGRNTVYMHDRELHVEGSTEGPEADFTVHKLSDAVHKMQDGIIFRDRLSTGKYIQPVTGALQTVNQEHDLDSFHTLFHGHTDLTVAATTTVLVEQKFQDGGTHNDESEHVESGELKKLDSFGRWMDKEIGGDCDNSLMASDSGNYWSTLDAHNEDKEVSSLCHMQLDMDSLGPSLSQEQLFSIHDFSPEWAYAGDRTKVLIVGTFLGSKTLSSETKWGCMFGEIEVSAEVLAENVIRCQTPLHSPGRVPFYVTCSNRLACSEIREFEYHENPTKFFAPVGIKISPEDEVRLQMRLLKLVDLGPDKKWLKCSVSECEKCKLKETMYSMRGDNGVLKETFQIDGSDHINPRDVLFQKLMRDRLYEWLIFKVHEGGKGPQVLDNEGQGVIHLAAALGYVWAMGPLIAVGISPNFRDAHGRTGLHWASYFGREETVIALVKLGAAPGAVEDPTSSFPRGQTAADLASSRGHKGIAGYLAEADLTSQLSTLSVNENEMDNSATNLSADHAFESSEGYSSNMTMDEQHYLKESLAAFQKSAHAAASIQAAFRARSFCQRQLAKSSSDISEVVHDLVGESLNKVQKMGHFEDYLHFAALKIQKKYRGWKGRNNFLKIRNRIIKIQAHIRGHQVRKLYKKVVWSVSIVEKAILRWRRKRAGLRGFRVGPSVGIVAKDDDKNDEYEFLSIGRRQKSDDVKKALDRVKSMVRHPEARDQYMRLIMKYQTYKIDDGGNSQSQPVD
ncbi:calmodulin-binding transcription activator 2-like isoform X2 [Gastrolobium bilobum]|uniref:calmodulin-binding transcription activator 2-like isoform X2 n=1 Tax=Gastrolobium bilobum TaxID=150636 RepID=UPI002AB2997D|nr:calmodulin-binding transcription activator 2-like isoform X2 [Gastrolobium bilobum]